MPWPALPDPAPTARLWRPVRPGRGLTLRSSAGASSNGLPDSNIDVNVERICSSSTPTRTGARRRTSSPTGCRPHYRDRVPVEEVDGEQMWVFDGPPGRPLSVTGGVIGTTGTEESAYRRPDRVAATDEVHVGTKRLPNGPPRPCSTSAGSTAQIIFPSTIGSSAGQDLGGWPHDLALTLLPPSRSTTTVMADDARPTRATACCPCRSCRAWERRHCVREARGRRPGPRGVHDVGPAGPRCAGPGRPVPGISSGRSARTSASSRSHFHIGCERDGMTFYGQYPWESHAENDRSCRHRRHAAVRSGCPGARSRYELILVGRSTATRS